LFHPGWLGLETIVVTSILLMALFFIITLTWLQDAGFLFHR
jgi:hypothetical protein